ncbi:hypothetical protein CFC21_083821 [Triticum aestivum]|uniref:Uncharacterized protein n=2 Tax=Triticum aestivum TaxID=4565 RepID=A0A9R1L6P0_WHEAT|nr:hypothetical protein CFC21_083821 [Triticum aestivum]
MHSLFESYATDAFKQSYMCYSIIKVHHPEYIVADEIKVYRYECVIYSIWNLSWFALGTCGTILLRRPLAEEELVRTLEQAVVRQAHHGAAVLHLPQLTRQASAEVVPLQHQPRERRLPVDDLHRRGAHGVLLRHASDEPVPVEPHRPETRNRPEAPGQPPRDFVAAEVHLQELARRDAAAGRLLHRPELVGSQPQLRQRRVLERGAGDRAGDRIVGEVQHLHLGESVERRGLQRPREPVVTRHHGQERRRQPPGRVQQRAGQLVVAHVEVDEGAHLAHRRQVPGEAVVLQLHPREGAQGRDLRRYRAGEGVAGEVELVERRGRGEEGRRYLAGEVVAGEDEDAEARRQRHPRRQRAVEAVAAEGEGLEERERGEDGRRERAGVPRGVEGDAGDALVGRVGGRAAVDAAGEGGAGVAGEVPRGEAGVGRDGGGVHGGFQRRQRGRVAREGGAGTGRRHRGRRELEHEREQQRHWRQHAGGRSHLRVDRGGQRRCEGLPVAFQAGGVK